MSISIRTLLIPGVAFATAGAVALGPVMVAPPAVTLAQPVVALPVLTIPDVQLAGFTLDLYNALNGWAQFGVQVAQDFFFWNPSIATGIGSLYTTFEPVATGLVTFIDTVLQGPAAIINSLVTLVRNLTGINLSRFTGLLGVTAASVGKTSVPRAAAARPIAGPRAAASVAELPAPPEAPTVIAEIPGTAKASRGELRRAPRAAAARTAAALAKPAAAASAAASATASGAVGTARSSRSAAKAVSRARAASAAG